MTRHGRQPTSRRELFRRIGRGAAAAGLAAIAAVLALRTGRRAPAGETCVNDGLCTRCGAFAGCRLPRARVVRRMAEGR